MGAPVAQREGTEPLQVTELFIKRRHDAPLQPAATIACSPRGIAGSVPCAPFRQALIASRSVTAELGLNPGDLRENIVVDCDDLYDPPSGTVVKIGQAMVRLTFHCEPCRKILKLIKFDRIVHRRGVFGLFLNDARIALGDEFAVTQQRFDEIPYAVNERIRWFLKKHGGRGAALDLVHELGLPASSGHATAAGKAVGRSAGREASQAQQYQLTTGRQTRPCRPWAWRQLQT